MNRLARILGAATVTLVAALPPAAASAQGKPACAPGSPACTIPADAPRPTTRPTGAKQPQQVQTAPRKGVSARHAGRFDRAQNSRFKAPPRGQEYRVMNDHLVLVDSRTLQVVTVLGLLNTLLR